LDRELILQQFDEIEKKVERLLGTLKSLEATNLELNETIKNLNHELQARSEAEKNYNEERELIRNKVDGLLVRLEEIAET
jgi:chromosome segregation ATPase